LNKLRFGDDLCGCHLGKHIFECRVQGDMNNGQAIRRLNCFAGGQVEHHRELVDSAQFCQQLGMARIVMAGHPESAFV
jgi:hypothetical protein